MASKSLNNSRTSHITVKSNTRNIYFKYFKSVCLCGKKFMKCTCFIRFFFTILAVIMKLYRFVQMMIMFLFLMMNVIMSVLYKSSLKTNDLLFY